MKTVKRTWGSLTGGEQLVALAIVLALSSTIAFAAIAAIDRPDDISNEDAAFVDPEFAGKKDPKPEKKGGKKDKQPPDRSVDWVRYGYDTARTKYLPAKKVRPPFRRVWRYKQGQLIEFAPIIKGKRMFFIDNDGVFVALNIDTGKVVWKKQYGKLNASSPHFFNGSLYAVTLDPPQALSVAANNGKKVWERDLPARAESSPIVVRKRVYFGTESGDFFALSSQGGKELWRIKLSGAVKAAPAFVDGVLYVGDYAGKMYAIRATDGNILWQTQDLGAGLGRTGRFYSTPAVAFGRVYAGNVDGRVYSFDAKSGEIAWTFSAGDFVYSGIAAAASKKVEPRVFFGSHDKFLYSVDARSGDEIWRRPAGGQVSGPATVVGDIVYISTFGTTTTNGFDIKSGRRVFRLDDGAYGPVVSDGERLYALGGSSITALKPIKIENFKTNKGVRGVIPPAELKKIRQKEKGIKPGAKKQGAPKGKKGSGGAKKSPADRKKKPAGKKKSKGPRDR